MGVCVWGSLRGPDTTDLPGSLSGGFRCRNVAFLHMPRWGIATVVLVSHGCILMILQQKLRLVERWTVEESLNPKNTKKKHPKPYPRALCPEC